jgi:hypothetical protein
MSNFLATAGATFDIAFIQHEPGMLCSTPIDCPFTQNCEDCLRYFSKSYDYAARPGTATQNGNIFFTVAASQNPYSYIPFQKPMAKVPTVTGYSPITGASNNVRDASAAIDRAITSTTLPGERAFAGFGLSTVNAGLANYQYHYTADTGW